MKREYAEDKHYNNTMFPKPHHQTTNFQHPPPLPPSSHLHHSFPSLSTAADCATSSEAGAQSPSNSSMKQPKDHPPNDGATIEVTRRPRGRPPGSKNKPRAPVIVTPESSEPPMTPYVLEVPPGVDVIEATTRFCRKRNLGLCVLNGYGVVSNVTLKQPSSTPGSTVTFHGRFDILSISATILPASTSPSLAGGLANGFTITLAGPQGQMVGGIVMGPLVSAATVYLISTTFNSPSYNRLQMDDRVVDGDQSPPAVSGGGIDGGGGDGSCGISIHSYQTSDVIWAPTPRQPQPPHPPRY